MSVLFAQILDPITSCRTNRSSHVKTVKSHMCHTCCDLTDTGDIFVFRRWRWYIGLQFVFHRDEPMIEKRRVSKMTPASQLTHVKVGIYCWNLNKTLAKPFSLSCLDMLHVIPKCLVCNKFFTIRAVAPIRLAFVRLRCGVRSEIGCQRCTKGLFQVLPTSRILCPRGNRIFLVLL